MDPTNSLAYLPRIFNLSIRAIQETVERHVQLFRNEVISSSTAVSIIDLLKRIKIALISEARRQIKDDTFTEKESDALFSGRKFYSLKTRSLTTSYSRKSNLKIQRKEQRSRRTIES